MLDLPTASAVVLVVVIVLLPLSAALRLHRMGFPAQSFRVAHTALWGAAVLLPVALIVPEWFLPAAAVAALVLAIAVQLIWWEAGS